MCVCVSQSHLTLCDPVNSSPPGSSVRGTSQGRILDWVFISFSRRSFRPRDQTQVSCIPGRRFNLWATREALPTKVGIVKAMGFPVVWMWELDNKEGKALKNWCFQTVVLEITLESPLDSKEIKPVNPKGKSTLSILEGLMLKLKL